jgi:ADP-heptose:LPS heptosyltransferase
MFGEWLANLSIRLLDTLVLAPMRRHAFSRFKEVRRICFIHLGGLGDYMLFSPIIKLFRKEYPNARITLITASNYRVVSDLFPEIDEVKIIDSKRYRFFSLLSILRQGCYDALLINYEFQIPAYLLSMAVAFSGIPIRVGCARNTLREKVLTTSVRNMIDNRELYLMDVFYFLAEAFFKTVERPVQANLMELFKYAVSSDARQQALDLCSEYECHAVNPRIVIHPGTSKSSKQQCWTKSWPVDSWYQLISQLTLRYTNMVIYLVGGPDDEEEIAAIESKLEAIPSGRRERVVNLYGNIPSIGGLAALMELSEVFIGCDSFAMHLALYVGTPLVAIFALTNEKRFLPLSEKCLVAAREDLPCRPCLSITRTESCEDPVCLEVPVPVVLEKVEAQIKRYSGIVSQKTGAETTKNSIPGNKALTERWEGCLTS